jgi:FtsP/CotA-like multicopper oxidase with cupredoxin domain
MPQGKPWGPRTCENTDPYKDPPHTGMTRSYDFTVSKKIISPDGVNKSAIVINDAFPGPTIEANWGDWISVTVHNSMNEGTALHWHGLLQKETQWMDGVPSVMQCPIAPGSSFTYRFRADLYGSSWYHSHYSAQAAGGLFGAMVIHGPHDNAEYDEDLGPVLLSDWYHPDYYDIIQDVMAPESAGLPPPMSNNNLINGKMNYPCQSNDTTCTPNAGVSKFKFESGKTYRIRLINSGAEGMQKFSIDNHTMTVIANDFVPVVPYQVEVVTLGIGQRSDIIVKATGKPTDAVWMRSTLGKSAFVGGCNLLDGISPEAVAAIYYQNANTTAVPTTVSAVSESAINNCANDPLTAAVPYYRITPDPNPSVTKQLDMTFQSNGTHKLWFMNNSTFRANYNDPILLEANLGNFDSFKPEYNVINFYDNSSIRIVIYNHAFTGSHP